MDINTLHKPAIHFKDMSWYNRFIVFCGVGFGSGLLPKAPGTFGSAFALLFIPAWLAIGFTLRTNELALGAHRICPVPLI